MTFDEYNAFITGIHDQLKGIADRTFNQAVLGCANPSNPEFIALMQKHNQLTHLSAELTERMMAQMSNGNEDT